MVTKSSVLKKTKKKCSKLHLNSFYVQEDFEVFFIYRQIVINSFFLGEESV